MHAEALAYITEQVQSLRRDWPIDCVVEIGSRDVNGNIRHLFPFPTTFVGVDIVGGRGVDVVADATLPLPLSNYDFELAICAEVFEHVPSWRKILANVADLGVEVMIVTAACAPRAPHSAKDGHLLGDDETEYYANVDPDELRDEMLQYFGTVDVQTHPRGDVYCTGFKA